jgi:hypothetical protein
VSLSERGNGLLRALNAYEVAMALDRPRDARNIAYDMLQQLVALYNEAYRADLAKARGEGAL